MALHQYTCPQCGAVLQSAEDVAGRAVRCLGCQAVFQAKASALAKVPPKIPPLPPFYPGRLQPKQLRDLLKRDHTLNGGILFGLDGYVIQIQARAMEIVPGGRAWRDSVRVSGMARGCVHEALDRIAGSFAKLSVPNPFVEILVNLTPPDLPKDGTWLDLPLAIIMLQAAGYLPDIPEHREDDIILVGELGLHAEVRRVPGILSIAHCARPGQSLIVPRGNEKECALILAKPGHEGCRVFPVATLDEVIAYFLGTGKLVSALKGGIQFEDFIPKAVDFGQVRGQARAKQAACIAAAGGHNLLLVGSPGEGKSLIASALPGILPRLTNDEKVQLTRIYSAQGALDRDGVAVTRRPVRTVHHTASKQAVVGGGSGIPRPGEITLAHLGVLFLDEIAEFSRGTLEALRQPIEAGEIVVSRVGATFTYPCRFTLVAAMNPCPCGYYGSDMCRCKEADVRKYQKKLSGPIVDRIDLQVELQRLTTDERFEPPEPNLSARMRASVEAARDRQTHRFRGTDIPYNAAIPGGNVLEYCRLSPAAVTRFKELVDGNTLSTRSMDRLAKVARTVADRASLIDSWKERVRAAEAVRDRRADRLTRKEELLQLRPTREAERDAAHESMARLLGEARVESEEGLQRRIEQADRLREIHRRIEAEYREPIRRLAAGAGQTVEETERLAAAAVGRDLDAEAEAIERELAEQQQLRDRAAQELGEARQKEADLLNRRGGIEERERMEAALARIRHHVPEYAALVLAQAVLSKAIERYREKHKSGLFESASRLFRTLTCGRFVRLDVDQDEHDRRYLVGVRPEGAAPDRVTLAGMSDGTLDQLYLALRLAHMEAHVADHGPFPIIVDDILLSFDDDRARAALRCLCELGNRTQVLFFTHHRHLRQMALEPDFSASIGVVDLQ
jgi:magnesium chelatase family protein